MPVGRKITINRQWSKSEVAIAIQENNQPWWMLEDVARDGGGSRGEAWGKGEDSGGERSTTKPIPSTKPVGRHKDNDDDNGPP